MSPRGFNYNKLVLTIMSNFVLKLCEYLRENLHASVGEANNVEVCGTREVKLLM